MKLKTLTDELKTTPADIQELFTAAFGTRITPLVATISVGLTVAWETVTLVYIVSLPKTNKKKIPFMPVSARCSVHFSVVERLKNEFLDTIDTHGRLHTYRTYIHRAPWC